MFLPQKKMMFSTIELDKEAEPVVFALLSDSRGKESYSL